MDMDRWNPEKEEEKINILWEIAFLWSELESEGGEEEAYTSSISPPWNAIERK